MHQGSFTSDRLELIFDDGFEFVRRTNETYDIVIVDGIDFGDEDDVEEFKTADYGNVLFSQEFFKHVFNILKPGGVFSQYRSKVDEDDYKADVLDAGFDETIDYCADIESFFGSGACFGLSAKFVNNTKRNNDFKK